MTKNWILIGGLLLLTSCSVAGSSLPTSTQTAAPTPILIPTATPSQLPLFTPAPSLPAVTTICTDPQATALIDTLKTSMLNADGALLASLVSPNGLEVRYFHTSDPVAYTREQTQFLFETTFSANWGTHPTSGLEKKGAFHDVVVPELVKLFNSTYTLHCNEIKHGGASYPLTWPYAKDFYSIYYAGAEPNGFLDWLTWAVGIEYLDNKPYIFALIQFFWEP